MTLATRCTACGTIFRVVQDQLRVSQGWVRCGRCGEAFNAVESMVDLPPPRVLAPFVLDAPTGAPAAVAVEIPTPTATVVPDPGIGVEPQAEEPAPTADRALARSLDKLNLAPLAAAPAAEVVALIDLPPGVQLIATDGAIGAAADVPRPQPDPAAIEPAAPPTSPAAPAAEAATPMEADEPLADLVPAVAVGPMSPGSDRVEPVFDAVVDDRASPGDVEEAGAGPAVAPSFIVKADRAARWRHPGVRAALALGVVLSSVSLAAQVIYAFRDRVAASVPALRPHLVQACVLLECRVGDVRQIDALSVESSGLVRVEGSPVYRFSVTLRNRAGIDLAAPALDLSLTDAQGRPIARRVLTMADLDLPLRTLKAGSELPIQVPLGIGDRQVSGYTVEIFYP